MGKLRTKFDMTVRITSKKGAFLYDHNQYIFNLTLTNVEETYPEDNAVEGKSIIQYFQ